MARINVEDLARVADLMDVWVREENDIMWTQAAETEAYVTTVETRLYQSQLDIAAGNAAYEELVIQHEMQSELVVNLRTRIARQQHQIVRIREKVRTMIDKHRTCERRLLDRIYALEARILDDDSQETLPDVISNHSDSE